MILIAALVCVRQGFITPWLPQGERLAPYFVLGIGFLLGWRFHRSRLAFVILILMLADRILYYLGPGGVIGSGHENVIFQAVAILLPLNIALFYFIKERGLLNLQGLIRFVFILVQPLIIYFILRDKPEIFEYLNRKYVNFPILDNMIQSQSVLFVYGATLLVFLFGSLLSKQSILRGFFWSLLAAAVALHAVGTGSGATLYFSVAGLIIILSVIETAYAMAYHDELTGLPARRSLNTTMQGLGRRYAIAMLDIDFFKKFNDRYGHDVGDQVLCMVASYINRVGGGGKPFRYGGEEFTVVFPGKSKEDVLPFLENLRESIADAQFGLRGKNRPKKAPKDKKRKKDPKSVSVTISIGVAEPGPDFSQPADVIKAADQALYRAKKKGRNCVAT